MSKPQAISIVESNGKIVYSRDDGRVEIQHGAETSVGIYADPRPQGRADGADEIVYWAGEEFEEDAGAATAAANAVAIFFSRGPAAVAKTIGKQINADLTVDLADSD